jgi:hypothetical protein
VHPSCPPARGFPACREGRVRQSGDDLHGRRRAKTSGITSEPGKSGGAVEIRGSGHSSEEARDSRTLAERRTRGSRWLSNRLEAGWLIMPATEAGRHVGDAGDVKPRERGVLAGRAPLTERHPGLKPYWGKPDVRNFREGAGNVTMGAGLRPMAKAVDVPPDPTVGASALYPTEILKPRRPSLTVERRRQYGTSHLAEATGRSGGVRATAR